MNWEPNINLQTLQNIQVRKLQPSHAAKVWNIEKFLDAIPEGMVKTFKACVVMLPDRLFPEGGIGVDPGLRLGLSYIEAEDVAFTLSLFVNRSGCTAATLLGAIQKVPILFPRKIRPTVPVVVEGAAYNARYGQVILAEVRAALILGFVNEHYIYVSEVQPKTIRKRVFGNGDIKPIEFWPMLKKLGGKDGCDALSMAICAGA